MKVGYWELFSFPIEIIFQYVLKLFIIKLCMVFYAVIGWSYSRTALGAQQQKITPGYFKLRGTFAVVFLTRDWQIDSRCPKARPWWLSSFQSLSKYLWSCLLSALTVGNLSAWTDLLSSLYFFIKIPSGSRLTSESRDGEEEPYRSGVFLYSLRYNKQGRCEAHLYHSLLGQYGSSGGYGFLRTYCCHGRCLWPFRCLNTNWT